MLDRKQRLSMLSAAAAAVALGLSGVSRADAEGNVDNQVLHQTLQWPPMLSSLTLTDLGVIQLRPPVQGPGHRSVTDATWTGGGGNFSWQVAANWSTSLIPDGAGAIARFGNDSDAPVVDLAGTTVTLNQLDFSDPQIQAVANGTIALSGPGIINASDSSIDTPAAIFTPGPADANDQLSGFNNVPSISGLVGITKTGDSFITLDNGNSFSGTINVNGGKIIPLGGDDRFGNAGNAINLNGGSIHFSSSFSTNRNITVSAGGGGIYWVGSGITFQYGGDISGSGSLELNGAFGSAGPATLTTAQSFTGTLHLGGGTVAMAGANGALPSVGFVRNAGTLIFDNSASESSVNRLNDAATIQMRGAALRFTAGGSNYVETTGPLNLDGGTSFVTVLPGGGGAEVHFGNLTRSNGAGIHFRGNNLGQAPGGGISNIFINNGTSLLVKGIIPFAWGNPSAVAFTPPEHPDNTLVTYGANGVQAITTFAPDFTGSTVDTNVRITSDVTVNGAVNANALVIAADLNFTAPGSPQFPGPALSVSGSGTIHVDSGVVLSAHAGAYELGGINGFPGNVIDANLDFGSREAVIMTPSALTLNGVISGSGGLTKIGGRTAQFAGANTYTGVTTLSGFNRFVGDVPADGVTPGAFGLSTSPIIVYGGNISPINPADQAPNGSGLGQLLGNSTVPTTFSRPLDLRGDNVFLRNVGTAPLTWAGNIVMNDPDTTLLFVSGEMVVTGSISGAGRVEGTAGTTVNFLSANTYTGGSDLEGTWGIGNNNALGTGSITMTAAGTLMALGGPRTISNRIYHTTGNLTIAGSNEFTIAGEYQPLNSILNVTNTATTTISGAIGRGSFFKTGAGTLVITGNNTFPGTMSAGNGTTPGGMIILRSNNATGSTVGQTQAVADSTVALDGGITIPAGELFIFEGSGVGGLGALRSLSGNNVWGGPVVGIGATNNVIGVDAGSTLTTSGAVSAGNATNAFSISKVGAGQLNVGSSVFGSTNGAIVVFGSLNLNSSTVRVTPAAAPNDVLSQARSISIEGGPAAPTGKLDLTNTSMSIIYGANPSPLDEIRQLIRAGYNGGNWAGNGITSSVAATSPNGGEDGKTGLGYAELSALPGGDPGDTSILIRYTYLGDSNLDGLVDVADLGNLASNWQTAGTWINGDFDYSGFIDVNDLGLLASNWQAGVGNPLAPSFAEALASVGLGNVAVPEPATLGLIGLASLTLRRRRVR